MAAVKIINSLKLPDSCQMSCDTNDGQSCQLDCKLNTILKMCILYIFTAAEEGPAAQQMTDAATRVLKSCLTAMPSGTCLYGI